MKKKDGPKQKARAGGGATRSGRPDSRPARPAERAKEPETARAAAAHSALNVRPLRDRIMVRRIEETEQVRGGIIIPDTAKEKPQEAEVVAVGSGRMLENGTLVPLSLKTGDRVLVGKWAGTEVKIEGSEYLILKEDEVLGVLG